MPPFELGKPTLCALNVDISYAPTTLQLRHIGYLGRDCCKSSFQIWSRLATGLRSASFSACDRLNQISPCLCFPCIFSSHKDKVLCRSLLPQTTVLGLGRILPLKHVIHLPHSYLSQSTCDQVPMSVRSDVASTIPKCLKVR